MTKEDLLTVYPNYVQLFKQVSYEVDRTPSWRIIRHIMLFNRLNRINKRYERWLNEWTNNYNKEEV